ncbi:MAG TPA: hypothetical protein VGO60_07625 [Iamia sp.]|jgi:hypothetical protein|nr:hypothetical protein [Iamia sp.]
MTEGPTPSPDGPGKGPSRPDPSGDETVAFAAETDLPEPLPVSSPPPPAPGVTGEPTAIAASESTPWRTRPVPPTTPTPGGPTTPSGPGGPGGPGGPTGPAPRRVASNALAVVAVAGVVVLVVVIVLMAVVLGGRDDDEGDEVVSSSSTSTTAVAPTSSTTESTTTTTTAPATTTTTTTPPPVTTGPQVIILGGGTDIEPGLFCRDLLADTVAYDEAVIYWLEEGRPARMDEDGNGVPCETVYPPADVEAVWGPQGLEDDGVTPGLFCRDLVAEGIDYEAAVTYWETEGRPARMDDDGNGRPCETVYPAEEVAAFWG